MDLHAVPAVPLAPPATDNGSVIIWVVLILVVVGLFLYRQLSSRIASNETDSKARELNCQEDRKAAWEKVEEREQIIRDLLTNSVTKGQETQAHTNATLEKMADSIDRLTDTIDRQSGTHQTRT
jgi:flagellar basal body-associated protein FliL